MNGEEKLNLTSVAFQGQQTTSSCMAAAGADSSHPSLKSGQTHTALAAAPAATLAASAAPPAVPAALATAPAVTPAGTPVVFVATSAVATSTSSSSIPVSARVRGAPSTAATSLESLKSPVRAGRDATDSTTEAVVLGHPATGEVSTSVSVAADSSNPSRAALSPLRPSAESAAGAAQRSSRKAGTAEQQQGLTVPAVPDIKRYRIGVQNNADPHYGLRCLLQRPQPFAPPDFVPGEDAFQRLQDTRVLVVGAGGLGCELLKCLCLSGFKHITVLDMDVVHVSNLHRQFLFRENHVGQFKACVAAEFLNSKFCHLGVTVESCVCRLEDKDESFYRQFQLVLSGLDSIEARRWLNSMIHSLVERDENGEIDATTCIPLLDGGTEGLKGQARFIFPYVTSCFECSLDSFPPQDSEKLAHMEWLLSAAQRRAAAFGIEGVTYALVTGVAKRIIPAIVSTNAIIAAILVEEAVKIATGCLCSTHDFAVAARTSLDEGTDIVRNPVESKEKNEQVTEAEATTEAEIIITSEESATIAADCYSTGLATSKSAVAATATTGATASSLPCTRAATPGACAAPFDVAAREEGLRSGVTAAPAQEKIVTPAEAPVSAEVLSTGTDGEHKIAPAETLLLSKAADAVDMYVQTSTAEEEVLSNIQNYIMYMGEAGIYTHTFEYGKKPVSEKRIEAIVAGRLGAM